MPSPNPAENLKKFFARMRIAFSPRWPWFLLTGKKANVCVPGASMLRLDSQAEIGYERCLGPKKVRSSKKPTWDPRCK